MADRQANIPSTQREPWVPVSLLYPFARADSYDAKRKAVSRWAGDLAKAGAPCIRRKNRRWEARGDAVFDGLAVVDWFTGRGSVPAEEQVVIVVGSVTVTVEGNRVEIRRSAT